MVTAKHNRLVYGFFSWYGTWRTRRSFSPVVVTGEFRDSGKPILLLSNHMSWWDGFWANTLTRKIFRRKFHFMMLEEQLDKFPFFKYSGGYPVRKNSRQALDSLRYTLELLTHPGNLVLLFPQGKIESHYTREFRFEKGADLVLNKAGESVQVIFLACLIDYFSKAKPGLYLYFREYLPANSNVGVALGVTDGIAETPEQAYNCFFAECLTQNLQMSEP